MSAVKRWLCELIEHAHAGDEEARNILIANGYLADVSPTSRAALRYSQSLGWAIIPQRPGSKQPCVKWKSFKDELQAPSSEQITGWYSKWPDAGVIGLLGPVSGLFAIDVDGEGAHRELIRRLGKVPKAPFSSRGKKCRYHLFFRHPEGLATQARFTPWHPQLEFRGHGGYVVLPPSLHNSGQNYRWKPGQSPFALELAEVPDPVLDVLKKRELRHKPQGSVNGGDHGGTERSINVNVITGLSRTTILFLRGEYANSANWNNRLFNAACDMAGNGIEEEKATPLLLAGAGPWSESDRENAAATIRSAFAAERLPARNYRLLNTKAPQQKRSIITLEDSK